MKMSYKDMVERFYFKKHQPDDAFKYSMRFIYYFSAINTLLNQIHDIYLNIAHDSIFRNA
jgi:hypothetical protein